MEEIEELRAKAIASMASSSANQKKPPKTKEEGELSSSDTDPVQEIPTCSSAVATTTSTIATTTTTTAGSLLDSNATFTIKSNQGSKTGKLASASDPACAADIRFKPTVKQRSSKPFVRNSLPSLPGKPYASTWHAPSVPDNNLVIRFSDDDSESDSQDERPHETSVRKKVGSGAEKPSAQHEPESAPIQTHSLTKRKPRVSLSRTFVSSLTKIHGANSRISGSSLAEHVTRIRNFDSHNNASAGQENDAVPRKNLNNSRLEDLRQQIALKENQLKLKSVQESKNTSSGLYLDHNGGNLHNSASMKNRPASGNNAKVVSNEPEKKRLKVEHNQKKSLPDDQKQRRLPTTKSELILRMPPAENIRQNNGTRMTEPLKEIAVGTSDTTGDKQQEKIGNMISVSSGKSNKLTDLSMRTNGTLPTVQLAYSEDNGGACQSKMHSPKTSKTEGQEVSGTFGATHSLAIDKVAARNVEQSSGYNEVLPSDRIQASPKNTTLGDNAGQINLLGHNQVNMQTLLKLEESYDKELEAAQDRRRRCELEEINALKAYREAQRALFEANARCTYLYQKRERFSAQFRDFMMEDPSSLWSSMWPKRLNTGMESLDNVPTDVDMNDSPILGDQTHAGFEVLNHDLNVQQTDGDIVHASCQQKEQNLVSEPCHERDASTTGLLHYKDNDDVNDVCTSPSHTNISADGDEDHSLFGHGTTESILIREGTTTSDRNVSDLQRNPEKVSSVDDVSDYARLEATLRSELFARLGTKAVSKSTSLLGGEQPTSRNAIECLVENEIADTTISEKVPTESGKQQISDIGGTDRLERSIPCHEDVGDKYIDYQSQEMHDPEESSSSLVRSCRFTTSHSSAPSPALKLVFNSTKVTPLISLRDIHTKTPEKCENHTPHNEESDAAYSELSLGVLKSHLRGNIGEVGCYDSDISIDPFWPVCTFELRGKCNDEECLLQHVKDYSKRNIDQHNNSENAGMEVELSSDVEKFSNNPQKCVVSAPPTYLVGLDILKADIHTSGSLLAQSVGQSWQKGFSTSSAIPFTIQRTSSPNEHQGSRSRQSMYLQSQDDSLKQTRHGLDEHEKLLEKALVIFDGEDNKLKGIKKARTLLSGALEANPTSVALWMVYLHIHYRNVATVGKEDMFSHAIKYNEGSYELWLMYINSRVHLNDRLIAYDSAISALCRHTSSPNTDPAHASACILDLFLQLVNSLCMSGYSNKAIQRIYNLLPNPTAELSNIISCLSVSDKRLFWVCCVYVSIYRKLPDPVVQRLDYRKELPFTIEWPSVELTDLEKEKALQLMKLAVDSVTVDEFLSTSHAQCVSVLEGTENSKNLLENYVKVHPSYLQLVLLLARVSKDFDNAIQNWPRDTPGLQCIWHQYAQSALTSSGLDFTKQLMTRWFDSVEEDFFDDESIMFSNSKDELYGLLNLSLHRLLQDDKTRARSAIDKALKIATQEDYEHCVKEHAVFNTGLVSVLNGYLTDPRGSGLSISEPLSRRFCKDIRKPRTRQLVEKLLGQVSSDHSLLNSVLEAWWGPALLPENYSVKEVVDLVESLLELYPANYELPLAVCELFSKSKSKKPISSSVLFWGCTAVVNSVYCAVVPEKKWVEAAGVLSDISEGKEMLEGFYRRGLSVYPFSVQLWKSYYEKIGNEGLVIEKAKERGIEI